MRVCSQAAGSRVTGVAEGLKLRDEAAGFLFGVDAGGEVVGAELLTGAGGGEHVPDDDDQLLPLIENDQCCSSKVTTLACSG